MPALGFQRPRWAFFLLGAFFGLGLVAPGQGRAERASVLMYSGAQAAEDLGKTEEAVAEALRADALVIVDAFAQARSSVEAGALPEAELAAFPLATQLMEEGWRSYLEVRPSFAAARLAQARTEALAVAHLQGGRELMAELSLRLGVTKLDLDRPGEAADDFRLSHALAPERSVSDSEFKPEVVAAFEAAISEERSWQTRPLQLLPADASLWVDGQAQPNGASQLLLQDGLHLLSGQSPGFHGSSQLVSVSAGVAAPLAIELEASASAMRVLQGPSSMAPGVSEQEAALAASAALLFGQVDALLLAASIWRRGEPALLGQLCSGQPVQCSRVVEVGYPAGGLLVAAAELWRSLKTEQTRFPPTLQNDARLQLSEKAKGGGKRESRSWLSNRWLWLGVAAASVTGTAIYLLSGDTELRPVFVGDNCSFGGC